MKLFLEELFLPVTSLPPIPTKFPDRAVSPHLPSPPQPSFLDSHPPTRGALSKAPTFRKLRLKDMSVFIFQCKCRISWCQCCRSVLPLCTLSLSSSSWGPNTVSPWQMSLLLPYSFGSMENKALGNLSWIAAFAFHCFPFRVLFLFAPPETPMPYENS